MVGHETSNKYRNSVPGDFFSQHSKVLTTVRFFMKHVHRANTTMCDMMWISGDHYARQRSHYVMVQKDLTIVNENVLYVPRYQISDQISKRNTSGKKRRKRTEKVEAVGYQNVKATLSLNGRVLKLMGLNKDLQEETLKLVKSHFTKKK